MKLEIKKILINYIFENSYTFDGTIEDLALTKNLFASGIFDSLEMIDFICFIENKWQTRISLSLLTPKNLDSVDSITDLVYSLIIKQGQGS